MRFLQAIFLVLILAGYSLIILFVLFDLVKDLLYKLSPIIWERKRLERQQQHKSSSSRLAK